VSDPVCIIGLGSPFGPDRLGWLVIERLRQNHALQSFLDAHIELISADRPGLNLLHLIHDKAQVLIIDTLTNCHQPGVIYRLDKAQLLQQQTVLSSHALGVAEALALGEKLGELSDRLVLFGLCVDPEVADTDFEWIKEMERIVMDELS